MMMIWHNYVEIYSLTSDPATLAKRFHCFISRRTMNCQERGEGGKMIEVVTGGNISNVSDLRGCDLLDDALLPLREIPVHPRIELLREAVRNERTLAANTFEVNGA